jgi:hypothetical protein
MEKFSAKKYFFDSLKTYFKEKGYSFNSSVGDPRFILKKDNLVFWNYFSPMSSGCIYSTKLHITHHEVEDVILEIGLPNNELIEQKKKKHYFLGTVYDQKGKIEFEETKTLFSEVEVDAYVRAIKTYMATDAKAFVDRYSFLPNLFNDMVEAEKQGKFWYEMISASGPEWIFRGLIISKLCNDPNFKERVLYAESRIINLTPVWQPYYEKLKERLKSLQPKYNV